MKRMLNDYITKIAIDTPNTSKKKLNMHPVETFRRFFLCDIGGLNFQLVFQPIVL